jgi:YbgC/YbaW family acyl-CoA thioester hydrolase
MIEITDEKNSPQQFEYIFTVTPDLLDGYNHVNNARYLDLYERARWDILEKSGLGRDSVHSNKIGPVIIEVNIRFSREILAGEQIKIVTRSRRKNDLVFYFDQQMINPKGEISSKAVFTSSLFDLEKRKIVKADEKWLKAMGF